MSIQAPQTQYPNQIHHGNLHSAHKVFPIIDLGDFILREQQDSDVESFFEYYSKNPAVHQFILCHIPVDLEDAKRELYYWRQVFYRGDGIYFAIADSKTNQMIGTIGLSGYSATHRRIELSYDLSQNFWRKGIMSKAIRAVANEAYTRWSINRIEANVAFKNIASQKLLEKCGFHLEGILRQHRFYKEKYYDICFFSLLKSDLFTS